MWPGGKRKKSQRYILFKGKLSFNPNTLNNQIYTFFLANEWQKHHSSPGLRDRYTYCNWIKLIEKSRQFANDFQEAIKATGQRYNMELFNDWSVYGDGMALAEYRIVGLLDTGAAQPYAAFPAEQNITSKMGAHKSVMADVDVDAQGYTKWFCLEMQLPCQGGVKKVVKFEPNSMTRMSLRVVQQNPYRAGGYKTNWNFVGRARKQFDLKQSNDKELIPEDFLGDYVYLKKCQYRFNYTSKLSNLVGFVTDSQCDLQSASPAAQGWRELTLRAGGVSGSISLKSIEKGLLIDLGNAVWDTHDAHNNPVYPTKYSLLVKCDGKEVHSENLDVEQLMNQKGGLLFVKGVKKLKDKPIEVKIVVELGGKMLQISSIEPEYSIGPEQRFKKASLKGECPFSEDFYTNEAQVSFYCYKYGNPVNQKLVLQIQDANSLDNRGASSFNSKDMLSPRQKIQLALKDPKFAAKYKSYEFVNQNYFQDKLEEICGLADSLSEGLNIKGGIVQWTSKKGEVQGSKVKEKQPFRLLFKTEDPDNTAEVEFINGKATIRFCLDRQLTTQSNPRTEVFDSIVFSAVLAVLPKESGAWKRRILSAKDKIFRKPQPSKDMPETKVTKQQQQIQSQSFTIKFFEVKRTLCCSKLDWVHDIGPIIKRMGLMYPCMENIVNLYELSQIDMRAMRRVFEIEDENHSRYMPSTREMSAITHRKIRKWLYQPIFNHKMVIYAQNRFQHFHQQNTLRCHEKGLGLGDLVSYFHAKKATLVQHVRQAFVLELTTSPLYTAAMFSTGHKNTQNVLKQILREEMKHLFVVCNILNALHEDGKQQKAVPFTDPKYLPRFPHKDLPVLKVTNDPELASFLEFDIEPCTEDQILRFIVLELPGEIDNLEFRYVPTLGAIKEWQQQAKIRVHRLNAMFDQIRKQPSTFKTIGQFYSEIIEQFWYLSDLEQYINAKLKQLSTNNKSKSKDKDMEKGKDKSKDKGKDKKGKSDDRVVLFSGDKRRQFTYFFMGEMAEVYDLRSALDQFRQIVEEGEGANLYSPHNEGNQHCHFIRFVEIFTGCLAKITIQNMDTNSPKIVVKLTKADFEAMVPESGLQHKWSAEHDRYVAQRMNDAMCHERINHKSEYPDAYSKVAFLNAYEKILEDLDYVFNIDFEREKRLQEQNDQAEYTDKQFEKMFEVARTRKMENSIAKMRQLRLHADRIMNPLGIIPTLDPKVGSRPDYNAEFSSLSYTCPKKQ